MADLEHPPYDGDWEREFYEDLFGRGPGDPDVYGYPGEEASDGDDS